MKGGRLGQLVQLLSRLPGVGEKTAQRYVLHLLTSDPSLAADLGAELATLHVRVGRCESCGNLADRAIAIPEGEDPPWGEDAEPSGPLLCPICLDPRRDRKLVCVVGRVQDLLAIERAGSMRGRYFVLGRLLSPLEGIGPDDLPIDHLVARLREDEVEEVILATPPSIDGEATALFLKRELAPLALSMSRIASGVPHGGDLEFADPITMGRALEGRTRFS